MTFELKQLGPFKIERTEDYEYAEDKSYAEMIRVRGSKPKPPIFMVPSHLYKFSETELALYMKDKKNLWRALGKLLNEDVDVSDEEIILKFSISKFRDVARFVPFMRKRGSGKLSPELIARRDALNAKRHTDKIGQTASRTPTKDGEGDNSHTLSARLEDFREGGDRIDRGKGEANTHARTVKPGKHPFDSGNGRDPRKEPVLPDDPGDEP